MKKVIFSLLVCCITLSFSADSFGDDKIDEKAKARLEKLFKRLDGDKDGKVTEAEFTKGKEGDKAEGAKKRFAKLDKDKDGNVTMEELIAGFKPKKKKDEK